ncbi:MAG: DUF2779 domain-containing protein [Sulfurimonas sp.]|nr:DUF2779 domain-containing protein [Sulfurimonas sp.]
MEITKKTYNQYLSKSLYIRGLQCHKALWLQKYRPELKTDVSASAQAAFDSGNNVGILAQDIFPDGVLIPYDGLTPAEQIEKTKSFLAEGTHTIYEATFSHDAVFVKADILHKGLNGWELYEVKGSTGLKEIYLDDISLQYYVLEGAGIKPEKAYLIHINKDYVRDGNIDVKGLFCIVDVTDKIIARQGKIVENLNAMRSMLQDNIPTTDIGPHCDSPYECPFCGYCWSHIPSPSVFDYADIGRPDAFEFYRQGIIKMEDVPIDKLGWRQKLQHEGVLYQKNFIDNSKVKIFLDSIWFPLCFMDFETTYMNPIPFFDGTRPYQQVPFQYSLHILDGPNSELRHIEFLADGSKNPQEEFFNSLIDAIPDNACILTWNKSFEKGRIKELKIAFPNKSDNADKILENIRDLMIPFREKIIYFWQFNGSYSIKAVLPALVPELSYKSLEISNGEMAALAWINMIKTDCVDTKIKIRNQLLKYCQLDTYAMVRILNEMHKLMYPAE